MASKNGAKKSADVVPINKSTALSVDEQAMRGDAGKGTSSDAADIKTPFLGVLQSLSPQVRKNSDAFIKGAEEGQIFLGAAVQAPLVDGEVGVLFQVCHNTKKWVEWVPLKKGGGFVARHDECPQNVRTIEDPEDEGRKKIVMENGNEIVETRYVAGLVYREGEPPMPYVVSLKSTGHTVFRNWNTLLRNAKRFPDGEPYPAFHFLCRLKTKVMSNSVNEWYVIDPQIERDEDGVLVTFGPTSKEYALGKSLEQSFENDERRFADERRDAAADVI